MVTSTLLPLVGFMREHGVQRLRLPDGLELELGAVPPVQQLEQVDDDRPAPVPAAFADVDGAGVCACGHSWLEHVEGGCVHGCSLEVCTSSSTPEPVGAQ